MPALPLSIAEYGDGALMVTVPDHDEAHRRLAIRRFRDRLVADLPPGVDDVVAGLESLLVEYDPLSTTAEQVAYALGLLGRVHDEGGTASEPRRLVVPFVVTPETAPDLDDVAAELSLSPDEVIDTLERSKLSVSLLAAAMAPMMDGLDVPRAVRRRSTPRTDVPAGSIMVAGRNAIVQPFPGPTGWRVIGRSPLRFVDIARPSPVSFAPGDVFSFRRIGQAEAARLDGVFLEVPS